MFNLACVFLSFLSYFSEKRNTITCISTFIRINVVINNIFAYNVATNIIFENEDLKPKFIKNIDREKIGEKKQ